MIRKDIEKHIGKRLKDKRKLLGLSQTQVAQKCNITFQQIQKYENGVNGLSVFRLLQMCNALDVPVSYFLEDIKNENVLQNFVGSTNVQQDQVVTPVVKTLDNDM